jgi:hypothetical protein
MILAHSIIPHHHDDHVTTPAGALCPDLNEEHEQGICGHLFSHTVHQDVDFPGPSHQNTGNFFLKYSILLFFALQPEDFSLIFYSQSFFRYNQDTGERLVEVYELFSGGLRAPPVIQS